MTIISETNNQQNWALFPPVDDGDEEFEGEGYPIEETPEYKEWALQGSQNEHPHSDRIVISQTEVQPLPPGDRDRYYSFFVDRTKEQYYLEPQDGEDIHLAGYQEIVTLIDSIYRLKDSAIAQISPEWEAAIAPGNHVLLNDWEDENEYVMVSKFPYLLRFIGYSDIYGGGEELYAVLQDPSEPEHNVQIMGADALRRQGWFDK